MEVNSFFCGVHFLISFLHKFFSCIFSMSDSLFLFYLLQTTVTITFKEAYAAKPNVWEKGSAVPELHPLVPTRPESAA